MQLSRKIAGEFAAVFLIGSIVGGLVVWDVTTDAELKESRELKKFMSKTNDPLDVIVARINQKYVDEYHLTPDEIEKIQPLVKEMAQHMSHIRHQFGVDIISTFGEFHAKIAAQLTPEHRDVYQKANEARKQQLIDLLKIDQSPSPGQGQK